MLVLIGTRVTGRRTGREMEANLNLNQPILQKKLLIDPKHEPVPLTEHGPLAAVPPCESVPFGGPRGVTRTEGCLLPASVFI